MGLGGKHLFGSIGDQRVTFLEKKIGEDRMKFLKSLMEANEYDVVIQEEKRKNEEDPQLYTIGVTDMTFNPTTYVFQRRLKTIDGEHIVNQDYWNQKSVDTNPRYWKNSK